VLAIQVLLELQEARATQVVQVLRLATLVLLARQEQLVLWDTQVAQVLWQDIPVQLELQAQRGTVEVLVQLL
jgi:hypothetical protein